MESLAIYRFKRGLWWSCLFLCLLSWVILLTFCSTWLYRLDVHALKILKDVPMTVPRLMHNYHQMISYVLFPWVQHLQMSDFPSSYAGAQHFADVKQLVLVNNLVLLVTTPLSIYFLRQLRRQKLLWQLQRPVTVMAAIPFGLLLLLLANFQTFFTDFHQILFRNQDWLFDPATDPIIIVLPETFFMHCFILAIFLFEGCLLVAWLIGRHALNQIK
ncbi:TIGR01906 family membrane protein [Loigolactobacillus binensis]|uniref:TIGR01906 family membrane protein n=1 Tax=Loigolactobacillus binensis TaxID=2559922 RepID=A0ABW3E9L3_9LACO|nr:TIGR01906 family membrane protein [Loigolactobacillus binensis]